MKKKQNSNHETKGVAIVCLFLLSIDTRTRNIFSKKIFI